MQEPTLRNTISERTPQIDALLQKTDVARRMNVSVRTVDDWVKKKRIPSIKISRTIRFRWSAVEAALQKYERRAIG